ncbi:hypothetical protein A4A49_55410 [Nicotiana attenuata]|uniref:RNase H type-1 domain-containing protein n=1 Tax=Nicotiana attenuata TaxID=49451 RepID=A0A1J6KW86_NICAT|nr:hypothetical protein A4A49_55410 [Nicotiana attenuata]
MEYKLLDTNQKRPSIIRDTILIKWKRPEPNTYKLNVDGSCFGNPGKGGIGGIIRSGNGEWVFGYNMSISHATNIYMEILALLNGLKLAMENNYLPLTIETDCKELINLIDNKNCSYNLIDDCRCLLSRAGDPPLQHVYRERLTRRLIQWRRMEAAYQSLEA